MRLQIVMAALTGQLETDMKRAEQVVKRRSRQMEKDAKESGEKIGRNLGAGIGVALTAAAAAVGVAFQQAIARADELAETSEKLGLSVEAFTSMGFAAKFSGIEMDKFGNAIRAFNSRIEKTEPLLRALNVETRDAVTGAFRPATDIIRDLGDTFQELPEGIEQSQLAAELFGTKLGAEMIPLLNRGTEGIRDMEDEAADLGAVLSKDAAEAAGRFNDQVDKLGIAINASILKAVPAATEAMENFTKTVTDPAFIDGLGAAIKLVADLANGFAILFSKASEAALSMKSFNSDQSDTQLDRRLAALQTRINAARQASGGELPANFEITMPDVARAMKEREQIIREIRRRALADQEKAVSGAEAPEARTTEQNDAVARLVEAMKAQQAEAEKAAASRRAAAESARDQAAAERELAKAVEEEARLMQEARQKQIDIELELADAIAAEDMARQQALQVGKDLISDLQFELELMKMTNAERATAIQLRGMDAEAVAMYGDEVAKLNEQIEANIQVTQQMDGLRQATSNLFDDLISGTVSAKDAFRSFVDDILANITRMIANNFAQSLFGGMGQSGGGLLGGFAQSLFGGLFGGGRAGGGPVSGGTPYVVGENGPELFIPQASGRIANNAEVRGMGRGGSVINISVEGQVDMRSRQQLAADVGRASQKSLARTY